jgi:hypothetical protein
VALARAWPELEAGRAGAGARLSQDRYDAWESENDGSGSDSAGRKTKGNGVNPAPGHPIYRGVHRIYPLRLLPLYNTPQRLYPEMFARRLRRIFRQQTTATT